jgi:hypothetical protein
MYNRINIYLKEYLPVLDQSIKQMLVRNIKYSAFGLQYTKLRSLFPKKKFEIVILPSVAFGIPIANGGVHGVIKLNVKAPRHS